MLLVLCLFLESGASLGSGRHRSEGQGEGRCRGRHRQPERRRQIRSKFLLLVDRVSPSCSQLLARSRLESVHIEKKQTQQFLQMFPDTLKLIPI